MIRFMPTSSGDLHFGHLGSLCVINYFAEQYNIVPYFVIDDIQVRNWGLYDKNFSEDECAEYSNKIIDYVGFLFPEMVYRGRFSEYENCFMNEFLSLDNIEFSKIKGYTYAFPSEYFNKTSNGVPIVNSLNCVYKTKGFKYFWNPFYAHEVVDKYLNTKLQIVDSGIYCPNRYLHDDRISNLYVFNFFGKLINRPEYEVIIHKRAVRKQGDIRKSRDIEDKYLLGSLNPSLWQRAFDVYKCNNWKEIALKLIIDNKDNNYPEEMVYYI